MKIHNSNSLSAREVQWLKESLSLESSEADRQYSEEQVIQLLAEKVRHLLDHEPKALVQLLYRLDIDESKAFGQVSLSDDADTTDLAERLAMLIVDRQKQRLLTRQEYANRDQEKMDWFNPE